MWELFGIDACSGIFEKHAALSQMYILTSPIDTNRIATHG